LCVRDGDCDWGSDCGHGDSDSDGGILFFELLPI